MYMYIWAVCNAMLLCFYSFTKLERSLLKASLYSGFLGLYLMGLMLAICYANPSKQEQNRNENDFQHLWL